MTRHRLRIGLTILLVILTLVAFIHYIDTHRYLLTQLSHTPLLTVVWLILLYALWFGTLYLILIASLKICKKTLNVKEGFLLNCYSTLVNFFVPGQGGIAVRGIYLKKVRSLPIKKYVFVTLLYYMFYAIVSACMALGHTRPIWEILLALVAVTAFSLGIITIYSRKSKIAAGSLDIGIKSIGLLLGATVLQAIIQVAIFAVELKTINHHITIGQSIAYTGVANFALFIALTPGAIGIRESFLVIGKRLHGISSSNIIAANVIDRSVFLVFLGFLFLLTIGFHARNRSIFQATDNDKLDKKDTITHSSAN